MSQKKSNAVTTILSAGTDNYHKLSCPECDTSHMIYLKTEKANLPHQIECSSCGKLFKTRDIRMRKFRRQEVERVIKITSAQLKVWQAKASDMSPGGAKVKMLEKLDPFAKYKVETDEFVAIAEPVWMKKIETLMLTYFLTGLKFTSFKPMKKGSMISSEN